MAINLLKRAALVAVLVFFFATGVRMMLDPDRFVRRSGMPKGGELLKTWNRDSMRLIGAIFVAIALYMLYHAVVGQPPDNPCEGRRGPVPVPVAVGP